MSEKEKIIDYLVELLQADPDLPAKIYKGWSNIPEDAVDPEGVIAIDAGEIETLPHNGVNDVRIPFQISGQTFPDADPDKEKIEYLESQIMAQIFTLHLPAIEEATGAEVVGMTDPRSTAADDGESRTFTAEFNLYITNYKP